MKQEKFDFLVLAFGQSSHCDKLIENLENAQIKYRIMGDADNPSDFKNATTSAYFAALDA